MMKYIFLLFGILSLCMAGSVAAQDANGYLKSRHDFFSDPEKKLQQLDGEENQHIRYYLLSKIYALQNDTEKSIAYRDSSLSINKESNGSEILLKSEILIAKRDFTRAEELLKSTKINGEEKFIATSMLAMIKAYQDSIKIAEKILSTQLKDSALTTGAKWFCLMAYSKVQEEKQNPRGALSAVNAAAELKANAFPGEELIMMTEYAFRSGKYPQAMYFLDSLRRSNITYYIQLANQKRYELALNAKDYKTALESYKALAEIKDSISTAELTNKAELLSGNFRTEKENLNARIAKTEADLEKSKKAISTRNYFIIGLLLLLIVCITLLIKKPRAVNTASGSQPVNPTTEVKNTIKATSDISKPVIATTEMDKVPVEMQPVLKTVIQPVTPDKIIAGNNQFFLNPIDQHSRPEFFINKQDVYLISSKDNNQKITNDIKSRLVSNMVLSPDEKQGVSIIKFGSEQLNIVSNGKADLLYILRPKGLKGLKVNGKQVLPVCEGTNGFLYEVLESDRLKPSAEERIIDRFPGDVFFYIVTESDLEKGQRSEVIDAIKITEIQSLKMAEEALSTIKPKLATYKVSVLGMSGDLGRNHH